jgi:hypothetical protein
MMDQEHYLQKIHNVSSFYYIASNTKISISLQRQRSIITCIKPVKNNNNLRNPLTFDQHFPCCKKRVVFLLNRKYIKKIGEIL